MPCECILASAVICGLDFACSAAVGAAEHGVLCCSAACRVASSAAAESCRFRSGTWCLGAPRSATCFARILLFAGMRQNCCHACAWTTATASARRCTADQVVQQVSRSAEKAWCSPCRFLDLTLCMVDVKDWTLAAEEKCTDLELRLDTKKVVHAQCAAEDVDRGAGHTQ